MQLIKLFDAYVAIEQMRYAEYFEGQKNVRVERELPFEQAEAIVKASAILEPHFQRYVEAERALINKYAQKDKNGNPIVDGDKVSFATPEDMQQYSEEITELKETEIDINELPIKMPKPNLVRCSWLESLDGIIEFV